jgi:stearoyl-CoA desaturase (Delta-9 desaturase)
VSADAGGAGAVVHTLPAATFARAQRRHFVLAVLLPSAVTVAGLLLAWGPLTAHPGWAAALASGMWFLVGGVGVSVGLHRHFSHRAFEATPALRRVLGVLGAMAAQGNVVYWVSLHRMHHAASDQPGDPHSPQPRAWAGQQPEGMPATAPSRWRAFWQGHIGWVWRHDVPKPNRYARDLLADPLARSLVHHYSACVALGVLLPAAASALALHGSLGWAGAALFGAYWGGALRIALGHHVIWAINSWCHMQGARPHNSPEHSTNVAALALLSWGESWHNNHHARPTAARFGQSWHQPDVGWWVVRGCAAMGWARLRDETPPAQVATAAGAGS